MFLQENGIKTSSDAELWGFIGSSATAFPSSYKSYICLNIHTEKVEFSSNSFIDN